MQKLAISWQKLFRWFETSQAGIHFHFLLRYPVQPTFSYICITRFDNLRCAQSLSGQLQGMNAEVQRIFNEAQRRGQQTRNRGGNAIDLEERLLAPEGIERRRQHLVLSPRDFVSAASTSEQGSCSPKSYQQSSTD
jgi:hypothetical protein